MGVCLVSEDRPAYVQAIDRPEVFLLLLLTSRRHIGQRIGARLIEDAAARVRAAGAAVLRVDCWADAPTLVAYHERQGSIRSNAYSLGDWNGVVFGMPLE